ATATELPHLRVDTADGGVVDAEVALVAATDDEPLGVQWKLRPLGGTDQHHEAIRLSDEAVAAHERIRRHPAVALFPRRQRLIGQLDAVIPDLDEIPVGGLLASPDADAVDVDAVVALPSSRKAAVTL